MELFVGALVVLGFLAILIRFLPRDAAGRILLPRIVDQSIGMWMLRRATGRRLGERAWDDEESESAVPEPAHHVAAEVRSPAPQVPPTVAPSSSVLHSAHRRQDHGQRRRELGLARALDALTILVALAAVFAVTSVSLAVLLQPRVTAEGEVLGATGTPSQAARPPGSSVTALLPRTSEATRPVKGSVAPAAAPTRRPAATPRVTPAPTPRSTPKPTRPPAPTSTPPPPPPVASITCSLATLAITCDGSGSANAVTYAFTFGDGVVVSGADATVQHVYGDTNDAAQPVSLTVTDSLGRTNSDSWTPS